MYVFKGFVEFPPLIDNTITVVAPLGELSPISRTYAREKTHHATPTYPVSTITGFYSKDAGAHVTANAAYTNRLLEAMSWIYLEAVQGGFTSDALNFQQLFTQRFQGEILLTSAGQMRSNGGLWMPEMVTLEVLTGFSANQAVLWLADEAFRSQYDEYEILVVPTIQPLDALFGGLTAVRNLANAVQLSAVLDNVRSATQERPPTNIRADVFDWVNPADDSITVPIDWVTAIYGVAGDNIDAIKQAITAHIASNTTRPEAQWAGLFPDLYTSTEFIFVPMWHRVAIPNLTSQTGLYRSSVPYDAALPYALAGVKGSGYSPTHIEAHAEILPTGFKGISAVVVAGPDNRQGATTFTQRYPDYLVLATTHPDFLRMSPYTRGFVLMLNEMFRIAENLNGTPPVGYTRVVRSGVVYLARTYERIQYLMVTRANQLQP